MKKYFTTGLVILLPTALTLLIVIFLINLLTKPFQGVVEAILRHYQLVGRPFLFLSVDQVIHLVSKFLVLMTVVGVIFLIGLIARWFFVKLFFRFGDFIFHRIPLVNKIYKACKDVVETLFSPSATTFSKVVLVPFPHKKTLSIGLISRDTLPVESVDHARLLSVFVPGTPNPMMGFMLMYRPEDVILLDMSVNDALKFILSCGVMVDRISLLSPGNNEEEAKTER